jgi:hypothetical protein
MLLLRPTTAAPPDPAELDASCGRRAQASSGYLRRAVLGYAEIAGLAAAPRVGCGARLRLGESRFTVTGRQPRPRSSSTSHLDQRRRSRAALARARSGREGGAGHVIVGCGRRARSACHALALMGGAPDACGAARVESDLHTPTGRPAAGRVAGVNIAISRA